jgi:putative FmdB family regulatory protein
VNPEEWGAEMPRYEYRCRECETTFELNRPMAESAVPVDCPAGHRDTVKLLSAVAVGGAVRAPAPASRDGGGCCGGGCCT